MSLRNTFSSSNGELNPAIIIRYALFLLLLIGLTFFYLSPGFRGLNHEKGLEQAQIAREVARGNGFKTKLIRPLSLQQSVKHSDSVTLTSLHDTYHAPLNPLLNSIALKFYEDDFQWNGKESVYPLDRVITGVSILFLLASIVMTYLLVAGIFDAKIGSVTALLMLLCEMLWQFSQSGLPQMLMLFLFTCACYFLYKALESEISERKPLIWLLLCAGAFGTLALAHWLAIWPFVGLLIFTAIYFKPRGVAAILMLLVFLAIVSPWAIRNIQITGTPLGSGYYSILGGMSVGEEYIYRNYEPPSQNIFGAGFYTKIINTSIAQLNGLYAFLGSIAVAPLFFLSLLHPFKRRSIANFRWPILTMWLFAVMGMSLFGLPDQAFDANQLHMLFIPIMTAYGLAFISILWGRIGFSTNLPLIRNSHLIITVVLSSAPMLLGLVPNIRSSFRHKDLNTQALQISHIRDQAEPAAIIVSDAPASVAWYGDRSALWLPVTPQQMREIKLLAEQKGQPLTGLLLTRKTSNKSLLKMIYGKERHWAPLITGQAVAFAGLRGLQPASWTQAGDTMIASMKDMDFSKLNRAMFTKGFFYLEEAGE
ncbi:MAG: glycosyltransferase family 39 protein [Verrucomicrobiaceae bacterium]|nr:glycosyltransferase family 39 protein [Verrucomicrobiaceae bacterium]